MNAQGQPHKETECKMRKRSPASSSSTCIRLEAVWRKGVRSRIHRPPFAMPIAKSSLNRSGEKIIAEREQFYRSHAASISAEDWRLMDQEEIDQLALPGDEQHIADDGLNDSDLEWLKLEPEAANSLHNRWDNQLALQWQALLALIEELDSTLAAVAQAYFSPVEISDTEIMIARSDLDTLPAIDRAACVEALKIVSLNVESALRSVTEHGIKITIKPSISEIAASLHHEFCETSPLTFIEIANLPVILQTVLQLEWSRTISTLSPVQLKQLLAQSEFIWICPSLNRIGIRPASKQLHSLLQPCLEQNQAEIQFALIWSFLFTSWNTSGIGQIHLSPPIEDHLAILDELLWLQSILRESERWVSERFIGTNPSYDELLICAKKLEYKPGWAYHVYCHLQKLQGT